VYLTLSMLSESVAARLREHGMRARTAQLCVRDAGLFSFVRQAKLDRPSNITSELSAPACGFSPTITPGRRPFGR
jgi:DNA polymerase-4